VNRQRLIILAVTLVTVFLIFFGMIYRPGWKPLDLGPKPCQPGQTTECVGGSAQVIMTPAKPASAAR
jgi:hypothetical protein